MESLKEIALFYAMETLRIALIPGKFVWESRESLPLEMNPTFIYLFYDTFYFRVKNLRLIQLEHFYIIFWFYGKTRFVVNNTNRCREFWVLVE